MAVIEYFLENSDKILEYTISHLYLISISITLSLIIWVRVGSIIRNSEKTAKS